MKKEDIQWLLKTSPRLLETWLVKPQRRVRIKAGWLQEHGGGYEVARVFVLQWWSVVQWDDEEEPDCNKTAGLEDEAAAETKETR